MDSPIEISILGSRGLNNAAISKNNSHTNDGIQGQSVRMQAKYKATVEEMSRDANSSTSVSILSYS